MNSAGDKTMGNRMSAAMGEAKLYRNYNERGNVVLARQTRTTIEELVGYRHQQTGKWVVPEAVAMAMGRPDLSGGRRDGSR